MLGIELRRNDVMSLSRQIYQAIRHQITEGRMVPDEALPSTRELAVQLAVSRNTVCEAYDMLLAEAYIVSSQGARTRVAQGIHLEKKTSVNETGLYQQKTETPFISDFRTGLPDLSRFPIQQWLKIMHKAAEAFGPQQLGYTGPEGLPALREEIARWLFRSRGILVNPQDVFITAGATHALHLLSEQLYKDPFEILVEDPCHTGMLRVMKSRGYKVIPLPVDEHGVITERLVNAGSKIIYVTPSHQFPLGGILPANRRAALIRYAEENQAFIIEDDYDSEFRYTGPTVAPLYTMDPDRVIYVGTFSKILFPALRIGYVILPRSLQERWRYLRIHTDVQNPLFEQAALADFMKSRRFDRHVLKMQKLYGHRRKVLLQALKLESEAMKLPPPHFSGDAAGLHLAACFPGLCFNSHFAKLCRERGLNIHTVDYHSIEKGVHQDKLLLGYGHLNPEEICTGVKMLCECILEIQKSSVSKH